MWINQANKWTPEKFTAHFPLEILPQRHQLVNEETRPQMQESRGAADILNDEKLSRKNLQAVWNTP